MIQKINLTYISLLSWEGSSQLHGEKGVEGNTFHNANNQKGK